MTHPLQKPSAITPNDLAQAKKLVGIAASNQWSSLMADSDLMGSLYYPVRQVPLPGFQSEMLLWQNDKLNVFSESGPKLGFKSVEPLDTDALRDENVKYKRADPYTVLALVAWGNVGIVFTNEVSQTSWEIIGLFELPQLRKHLDVNSAFLVDYDLIESSFAKHQEELEKKPPGDESDDEYWSKYGQSSEPEDNAHSPAHAEGSDAEDAYWSKHGEQTQIDENGAESSQIRDLAVQTIVDLAELYKDCGVHDLDVIIDDIKHVARRSVPPSSDVPPVPRRHAERTIRSMQRSNPFFEMEIMAAVHKLQSES